MSPLIVEGLLVGGIQGCSPDSLIRSYEIFGIWGDTLTGTSTPELVKNGTRVTYLQTAGI